MSFLGCYHIDRFYKWSRPVDICNQGTSCSKGQLPVLTSVLGSVPWKPSFLHPEPRNFRSNPFKSHGKPLFILGYVIGILG